MPAVAQIMASRSAHTEEREARRWRERLCEREGSGGREVEREGGRWGQRGEADCMCRERKRILKKGREEQTDNEKGKRREQKASAIRRRERMRNVCTGGRCVVCVRLGVCTCVNACMCVSLLALSVHGTDWKK